MTTADVIVVLAMNLISHLNHQTLSPGNIAAETAFAMIFLNCFLTAVFDVQSAKSSSLISKAFSASKCLLNFLFL